jgi:hypothetical protein
MCKIKETASQDGSKSSVRGAVKGILCCSLAAFLPFHFARSSSIEGIFAAGSTTKKANVGLPSLLPFADEAQVSPSLRGKEDSLARESPPSLFSQVAPLFFPIDAETGLIAFPVEVKTVVFDIGARESDYLRALESTKDPSVALILVDPLPSSMIPIEKRAAEYALNERGRLPRGDLNPKFTDRVFTVRAAIVSRIVVSVLFTCRWTRTPASRSFMLLTALLVSRRTKKVSSISISVWVLRVAHYW